MAKGRAVAIVLDEMQRAALTALSRKHGAPQSLAVRARIVLSAARGLTNQEIAAKHDSGLFSGKTFFRLGWTSQTAMKARVKIRPSTCRWVSPIYS